MTIQYSITNPEESPRDCWFMVSVSMGLYNHSSFSWRGINGINGITGSHHGDFMGDRYFYVDKRYDADEIWLQVADKLEQMVTQIKEASGE